MAEIKKIVIKVLCLFVDIFLLGIKIIKQTVLPGKSNNGNIISSILVFFIGLVERLYLFEHGFFKMTNIFKLKYVRRVILIIAGILFILASFECTVCTQNNSIGADVELISSLTHAKEISDHQLNIIEYPINKENLIAEYPCVNAVFISPVKKYLFTHSLLI